MRHFVVLVSLTWSLANAGTLPSLQAQSPSQPAGDEAAIRQVIADADAGKPFPFTSDRVAWTGAHKRPIVGNEKPEEIPGPNAPSNRKPDSNKSKTKVVRIEVAKSGDLAYEFSNSELSFETASGNHVRFPRSALRVWRKEQGTWKVAAVFVRPHYNEPPASTPDKQ